MFFLNCRALEKVLDLAKMSVGWLRKLLGQECALQGRLSVPKPEVGEAIEIKNYDEQALVYGDPQPFKPNRHK